MCLQLWKTKFIYLNQNWWFGISFFISTIFWSFVNSLNVCKIFDFIYKPFKKDKGGFYIFLYIHLWHYLIVVYLINYMIEEKGFCVLKKNIKLCLLLLTQLLFHFLIGCLHNQSFYFRKDCEDESIEIFSTI